MSPQTRRQVDTLLGWVGYSLSYTEQDTEALASGPALEQLRIGQGAARMDSPATGLGTPSVAGHTSNARIVLGHVLEALAEGLSVCAGTAALFVRATYRYGGQLLQEYRSRDHDRHDHADPMRRTLRVRVDECLERSLDVAETRARALSPMPVVRRARTAFAVAAADRMERIVDRGSQLATTLSPARALDRAKGALRAKVARVKDRTTAVLGGGDPPIGIEREKVSQPTDASADVKIARIWWPAKEREDEQMSIAASRAEAQAEPPALVVEPTSVHPTLTAEPVVDFRVETPRPELKPSSVGSAGPSADAPSRLSEPIEPVEPILVPVETLSLPETAESATGTSSSLDPPEPAIESSADVELDHRPRLRRWSSFFSFLRPRETRAPSLLGRSSEDVTRGAASDPGDAEPVTERSIALERLEKMLKSSGLDAPTEAELKDLSERGPRYF